MSTSCGDCEEVEPIDRGAESESSTTFCAAFFSRRTWVRFRKTSSTVALDRLAGGYRPETTAHEGLITPSNSRDTHSRIATHIR